MRKLVGMATLVAALALVAGGGAAQALPGMHTIAGNGTAGGNTVVALSASEATQTGSTFINGLAATIGCVNVWAQPIPATHLVTMHAVDIAGVAWVITIRESAGVQTLLLSQTVTSMPCGGGAAGWVGPGAFLITP